MTITKNQTDNIITLVVDGRVDSNTAPALQTEILGALQSAAHLVLDVKSVPYISSAGLRALLIGQKTATSKQLTMELLHVQPAVMNILDSVGFSKILTTR